MCSFFCVKNCIFVTTRSDAERECDEEEGEEKPQEEEEEEDAKEDYNDGLPPLADVLKEIKTVPSLENSIMRIDRVLEILNDFRCVHYLLLFNYYYFKSAGE